MKTKQSDQIQISCSKCGAAITSYNANTTFAICEYCGAERALVEGMEDIYSINANDTDQCILFERTEDEFKDKILKWLIADDRVPGNILTATTVYSVDKTYYPVYTIKGTYEGTYSTLTKHGKVLTEGTNIHGEFTVVKYAGKTKISPSEEQNLLYYFNKLTDKSAFTSIKKVDSIQVDIIEGISPNMAWDDNAKLKASAYVYDELKKQDTNNNDFKHYLKYNVTSVDVLYYPIWSTKYSYANLSWSTVYMDEVSGELNGDRPIDGNLVLNKTSVFKTSITLGVCLWFGYYILRIGLGYYVNPKLGFEKVYNNIILSDLFGLYWLLRGFIFCLGIPILNCTVFFKKFEASFYRRSREQREHSLDLILSGKAKNIFTR